MSSQDFGTVKGRFVRKSHMITYLPLQKTPHTPFFSDSNQLLRRGTFLRYAQVQINSSPNTRIPSKEYTMEMGKIIYTTCSTCHIASLIHTLQSKVCWPNLMRQGHKQNMQESFQVPVVYKLLLTLLSPHLLSAVATFTIKLSCNCKR